MKVLMATAAFVAVAMASPVLAQAPHTNQSNEGIQSPTQQQRLDGGAIIPHGASGRDTVNLGGHGSGSEGAATQGQAPRVNRPDVIKNNQDQGNDPDPRVRQELRRDPPKGGQGQ
jgi:hypothetical protein